MTLDTWWDLVEPDSENLSHMYLEFFRMKDGVKKNTLFATWGNMNVSLDAMENLDRVPKVNLNVTSMDINLYIQLLWLE